MMRMRERRWTLRTRGAAATVLGLMCTAIASAELTDLVVNGELEMPEVTSPGGWTVFPSEDLPGWTSSEGMELWQEGVLGSPALGSDGAGTGQHLEMNDSRHAYMQQMLVPDVLLSTTATLRFDAWRRVSGQASYSVTGSTSGALASGSFNMNMTSWTANEASFEVVPGEMITLTFTSTVGGPGNSAHLDAVELIVDVRSGVVGDLDGDGQVGVSDLLALLSAWGSCGECADDLDGDGSVGVSDLLILFGAWSA